MQNEDSRSTACHGLACCPAATNTEKLEIILLVANQIAVFVRNPPPVHQGESGRPAGQVFKVVELLGCGGQGIVVAAQPMISTNTEPPYTYKETGMICALKIFDLQSYAGLEDDAVREMALSSLDLGPGT